jgi:hypothetical protein
VPEGLGDAERDADGVEHRPRRKVPAEFAGRDRLERDSRARRRLSFDPVGAADPQQVRDRFAPAQLLDNGQGRQDVATGAAAGDDEADSGVVPRL